MDIDTPDDLKIGLPELDTSRPYISVIIPALNEERNINAAIRSARDPDAEILVIDGGSTDLTRVRANRGGARVERARRGRALQQNLGASKARGNVFLFLHADTCLPHGYVPHVFETLMDPSIILGAFQFKTDGDAPAMKVIEFVTNLRSRYFHLPYGDQALFMRKSAFGSVGGFPEVALAEDLFLVRRSSGPGKIGIAPAKAVTSARRWQAVGPWRTTLINQIILLGCLLRISPATLARLYGTRKKSTDRGL
ncbi:MAG: TIGR04283 family arsenosugar biosynthesis glycosyltransferase [Deltaproteobacteria bacterium]|nr:TIGR04283 family arsenosugar biosynthesis glycosyltransferase [Deltaproteobacteria bacterium]